MREADNREEEKFLRWKLECCYSQGQMKEALQLGRKLDEMQCRLFREAAKLKKAAG